MTKLSHQQAPLALDTNDVATKRYVEDLRRVTASGDYIQALMGSSPQTDVVATDTILLDTTQTSRGSLQLVSNQITGLRAGRTYLLEAAFRVDGSTSPAGAFVGYRWYDATQASLVGTAGSMTAIDATSRFSTQPCATHIFTPTVDTVVEVQVINALAGTDILNGTNYARVTELGSTVVNALGGLEFMDVIEVTANTQTVSFGSGGDGLYGAAMDGDIDETYLIEYFLPGGVVSNFEIRPNGLTTNMFSARHFAGSAEGNQTFSTLSFADHFTVDRHASGRIEFYAKSGKERMYTAQGALAVDAPGNRHTDNYAGTWTDTGTNITSLDIHATAAGAITAGSYFALWRRRTGNAVRADSADSYERRVEAAVDPGTATEEYTTGHTIYAGSIVGLTARVEEAVTAGTVTVNLKADGATVLSTVLDTTNTTSNRAVVPLGSQSVGADKNISVEIVTAGYDNAGSLNSGITVVATLTNEAFIVPAVPPYMPGHVDGLEPSFNTVSTVDIAPGTARDSTNTANIDVSSTLTADITASGANGLDTGSEATSTWYALYVIADSLSINAPAALLSANFSSPTMPAGYDVFRRVGSVYNNGSDNIEDFTLIRGKGRVREYSWVANGITVVNGSGLTVTQTLDLSNSTSPVAHHCNLYFSYSTGFAQNGVTLYLVPTTNFLYQHLAQASGSNRRGGVTSLPIINQSVHYVESGSDVVVDFAVQGFTEEV